MICNIETSVVRQKVKSQKVGYKKKKHIKFSEKLKFLSYVRVRIWGFLENLACFLFFLTCAYHCQQQWKSTQEQISKIFCPGQFCLIPLLCSKYFVRDYGCLRLPPSKS